MIISVNWLKKFTDVNIPIKDLVELIGTRLVEVEDVIDLGSKYKDVLIVRVVSADKLEGSDHLSLVKIDDGGVSPNIERDENRLIQVVCGAPNIAAGQTVAWLPPKSTVPESYNSGEPFVLDSRQLRGVTSNGMIASAKELDLFDENTGILVLDGDLEPGSSFATAYELDDYLLDIENKSLTHRPDVFGIIGFAREVAAIQGNKFTTPDLLLNEHFDVRGDFDCDINISVDDPQLCSRYQAVVVSGAQDKQTPLITQTYLARSGLRPINAIVDVTNYMMLLTGQPLHAFDFDKLVSVGGGKADIHVRSAHDGEELELLDGKKVKLATDDIVIASGETAIGLAGAMGGANTEIDKNTHDIIIESATFNLYNLRGTQMRHGIFSEAITRFTKGQPARLTAPVINEAIRLMDKWAGAKPISDIADAYPSRQDDTVISTSIDKINNILGTEYSFENVFRLLENAEFNVQDIVGGEMKVAVPWWRADVHVNEDVAEEVGRLSGFDNIETTLPLRDFTAVRSSEFDEFKTRVRKTLVRAGANEVLTYSFVHGDVIKRAGQDTANSYRITNSISPDLQYYRQTLIPSLLNLIHPNVKQGFDQFAVFELNKSHDKSLGLTDENVPVESDSIALVVADSGLATGATYFRAKQMVEYLTGSIGVGVKFENITNDTSALAAAFESKRSARIVDSSGLMIGVVGEFKKFVSKNFKLPKQTAGFEVDASALFEAAKKGSKKYQAISRYPSTERDICFRVDSNVRYSQIVDCVRSVLESTALNFEISPVDIYQTAADSTKNITTRVKLSAIDHTMTGDEATEIINQVINLVVSTTRATVI